MTIEFHNYRHFNPRPLYLTVRTQRGGFTFGWSVRVGNYRRFVCNFKLGQAAAGEGYAAIEVAGRAVSVYW